jgi:RNA polymerase sigma-70 factor (TIGR02943 family)
VRVNDRSKAEDLVQETLLAGLNAADKFQGKSTERTWLTSILKRKIIDIYRKNSTSRELSFGEHESTVFDADFYQSEGPFKGHWLEGSGPHSNSLMPDGAMEQEELARFIQHCIEHLPPQLAAAFIMKMIDEEEADLICKELGISTSNLWVMLHRARLKMRKCLENKWLN